VLSPCSDIFVRQKGKKGFSPTSTPTPTPRPSQCSPISRPPSRVSLDQIQSLDSVPGTHDIIERPVKKNASAARQIKIRLDPVKILGEWVYLNGETASAIVLEPFFFRCGRPESRPGLGLRAASRESAPLDLPDSAVMDGPCRSVVSRGMFGTRPYSTILPLLVFFGSVSLSPYRYDMLLVLLVSILP
jgi:hypothetical protein